MKIGVIGLGSIAKKAYLPVYTTQFPEHDWYFSTRTEEKLRDTGRTYGVPEERQFTDWQDLLDLVDAVFIHTPTDTHEEVCRAFLEKGIPVFVDKPLTEYSETTNELLDFADKQDMLLMTGFNRRFAPMVQEMKQMSDVNHLILQKNQVNKTDFDVRYRIYDLMIHPLDTALYLMDEPAEVIHAEVIVEGDQFKRASVLLKTTQATAYVAVNNESGTKLEKYEVQSQAETVVLENLTDKTTYTEKGEIHTKAGDWVPTLEKRGFIPMIKAFIEAVETGSQNPVSLESARLSHHICETIIQKYENRGS
ncbi:virulence factor [Alkalibacterium subtropicum]|uniref:Virulence factor n=1 Tax=Alkalibacterium subtropicum TaxID=753702 RepID=A0A1I1I258_9LACT|nr:Gfo/Idh/MocA family oxidoreductase [Alkalibacterium subtropicum]SFC30171.1 virulence factor [Alkalibacterium subtropicum]